MSFQPFTNTEDTIKILPPPKKFCPWGTTPRPSSVAQVELDSRVICLWLTQGGASLPTGTRKTLSVETWELALGLQQLMIPWSQTWTTAGGVCSFIHSSNNHYTLLQNLLNILFDSMSSTFSSSWLGSRPTTIY